MKNNNQINVFDVVHYMVFEKNIKASNLTLNKLVYYSYAKYLIDNNTLADIQNNNYQKLIPNYCQAWVYGPVFYELYRGIKQYLKRQIVNIPKITGFPLTEKQKSAIEYATNKYGNWHPWDLVAKTHMEDPWKKNIDLTMAYPKRIITDESIFNFYFHNKMEL
ncbi:Uncharacterized phage-associated protein [Candidatus Phytoplasma australiense]|uniref:Uncharacterized phage-associated protein n=1 Tax=Phytoplasma australiense TaxID=59748 RepID=B1V9G5_PHYAS|nr:Uncharacterized phage-associated protein [Candidatus Phytoplasma australiense]